MPNKKILATSTTALIVLLLNACTTTGVGSGELVLSDRPSQPVLFSWTSNDGGITGSMTAAFPGAKYQGRFIQIRQQTQSDALLPMWNGWNVGWADWPYSGFDGPETGYDSYQFSTTYSGKVIANLKSDTGKLMRCRFTMAQPVEGMSGGGSGECQIVGGATIQATF